VTRGAGRRALRLASDREALLKLRHAARQLAAERFAPEQVVGPLTDRLLSRTPGLAVPGFDYQVASRAKER